MYVSSIFLDRFGRRANLRLANLANGLNVICGPQGSGKSTLVDFLRAMWSGFDTRLREQYLPPESRGFGGAISVETAHGRQTISRYDDGGLEGRLTVEREDGAVIGRRHLHDLIGDVSASLLERAFLIDFHRRPQLEELLAAAMARGYELGDSDSLMAVDSLLAEKRARLSQLAPPPNESFHQQHPGLANGPDSNAVTAQADRAERDRQQLRALDVQLARWKRTLRDVAARKQRAAERSDIGQLAAAAAAAANAAPRQRLLALETQIHNLKHSLAPLSVPENDCVCQALRATLADSLQAMRDEVYQLCNDLNHWHSHHQHRKAVSERDQLTRCEKELRQAIQSLSGRRQALMKRIVDANPVTCCHPDHEPHCQCTDHPRTATQIDSILDRDADLEGAAHNAELRRNLSVEIGQLEEESKRLHDQASSINLVRGASQYLRRLSSGEWSAIDAKSTKEVWVTGTHDRRLRYDDLDSGTRDQVYLAFCLAVVAACDCDGIRIPLVLNDAFTHYPSKQVVDALELLCEIGRDRQVLCLTRQEHAASQARLLNVPVHSLSNTEAEVARPGASESSESPPSSTPTKYRTPRSARRNVRAEQRDAAPSTPRMTSATPTEQPSVEYYLSESDPIERAPSVDETNANCLRRIGILRVADLLRDPVEKFAADLQSWGITRDTVQSWQSQARLMCRVRRLRPYDARILVACGITEPKQLMEMSSMALRARVKEFAASAKGQAILLSGTESEFSRVMEWVQLARKDGSRKWPRAEGANRAPRSERGQPTKQVKRRRAKESPSPASLPAGNNGLRFLLQRSDRLADVPSIGPGLAQRLEKVGLVTVHDLLTANAEAIAARLQLTRVAADTVRRWQQQLELVCRVPQLSSQNAQILVSVGVRNLEELAAIEPNELWQRVQSYCVTLEGKRSLRKSSEPSAAEVTAWVHGARYARALHAA